VQASQFIELLKPIPKTGTSGWKVTKKIVGIHESSEGVTTDNEIVLVGPDGEKYTRMIAQARYLKGVANGAPFDKTIAEGFAPGAPISSLGRPTWTAKGPTWPEQSVLYRLNGDYNPLHIDPSVGKQLGYGGLICHGLGMYSITARALLEKLSESDPSALQAISALFIGPLVPGDTLDISIWDLGPGPKGSTSIAFEARNSKGSLCLGEGQAYVVKKKVLPETNPIAAAYDPTAAGQLQQPTVTHVANAPQLPKNPWDWLDSMFTFDGIPIRVVLTVIFFLPAIIFSTLQVIWTYVFGWWLF